jgi:hypothetical protein
VLTYGKDVEERPHPYEDSCGDTIHLNGYDENLNTFFIEEKDQGSILIIGEFIYVSQLS